ncbi:MAG: porin family protein [Rhizobiales bacterium]|nr:porin family protein [Hyphomicrobiales bacterium]
MRIWIIGFLAAGSASIAPFAKAQDAPAWSWSGSYLGIHAGMISGAVVALEDYRTPAVGPLVGAHIGRDWQHGRLVFGMVADLTASWADNRRQYDPVFKLPPVERHTQLGASIALRGRIGALIAERVLIYATGGPVLALVKQYQAAMSFGTPAVWPTPSVSRALGHYGVTMGVGAELRVTTSLSIVSEYRHTWLNARAYSPMLSDLNTSFQGHEGRIALNYRF